MSQIEIIPYCNSDYESEIELLVHSFFSKLTFRQFLSENEIAALLKEIWQIQENDVNYLHLVAKKDAKLVGVILVKLTNQPSTHSLPCRKVFRKYGFFNTIHLLLQMFALDLSHPKGCYVEHLAVHSSYRGAGIGGMLIQQVEFDLCKHHQPSLSLIVEAHNPAKRLYLGNGFTSKYTINSYLTNHFVGMKQWVFMEKSLPSFTSDIKGEYL